MQWKSVEDATQHLTYTMSSEVLQNLIELINVSYRMEVTETIQAAVLLTGIYMADHFAQFTCRQKEIKAQDEDDNNELSDGSTIKKSQSSMAQLNYWYDKLYHKANKKKKSNLAILENVESFDGDV